MSNKVNQIKKNLKQARNFSYLTKYQQSEKIYKEIIECIEQQIILNNISRRQIEEWRRFQAKVIQQKAVVHQLILTLGGLRNSSIRTIQQKVFDQSYQFDAKRRTNNHFRSTNKNFSISKVQNNKPISKNNLEVWDHPPPQLPQKRQGYSVKKPQKANFVHQNNHNPSSIVNSKLNRPTLRGKTVIKQKQSINIKNGKKTFLLDRYPNGSGPDSNLIEMLEKQVMDASPNITFDDIAQLQTAKTLLQQAVLLPLKMPQFFTGIRRAWKGVLMFGPPGTGKTLLAKAVASNGGTTFFNVSASSLASKWKGQSQKLVRILFQMAKFYAPSVIFFDEIDALGGRRKEGEDESNRKVKTQLLVQMDGATSSENQQNKFVIVLAATNRPWDLDQALRRRLEKRIYIPLPTAVGRKQLVRINLKSITMQQGLDLDFIIKRTQGFSGADITNVCRQAAYQPMRRKLKSHGGFKNIVDLKKFEQDVNVPLTKQDFLQALKNVNKSVGGQDLKKYEQWMKQFGTV